MDVSLLIHEAVTAKNRKGYGMDYLRNPEISPEAVAFYMREWT